MVPLMVLLHLLRYLDNPDHVMSQQHWPKSPSTHSFNVATLIKGSSGTTRLVQYNSGPWTAHASTSQISTMWTVRTMHMLGLAFKLCGELVRLSHYHAITLSHDYHLKEQKTITG